MQTMNRCESKCDFEIFKRIQTPNWDKMYKAIPQLIRAAKGKKRLETEIAFDGDRVAHFSWIFRFRICLMVMSMIDPAAIIHNNDIPDPPKSCSLLRSNVIQT